MTIDIQVQIDDALISADDLSPEDKCAEILDQAREQLNDGQWEDQVIDYIACPPNEYQSKTLILPTILVPSYGHMNRYLAKRPSPDDATLIIDHDQVNIWQQLTGRRTLRDSDPSLIADLTQGRVRIK